MSPGQELVDLRGGMAGGDGLESGLEAGVELDPVHLRRLDQGGDPTPRRRPFVVAGEQCILWGSLSR